MIRAEPIAARLRTACTPPPSSTAARLELGNDPLRDKVVAGCAFQRGVTFAGADAVDDWTVTVTDDRGPSASDTMAFRVIPAVNDVQIAGHDGTKFLDVQSIAVDFARSAAATACRRLPKTATALPSPSPAAGRALTSVV